MTIRDQYIELKSIGFTIGIISKHTGITKTKLENLEFQSKAKFTIAELMAFDAYYQDAKRLAVVYGEKLAEYLNLNGDL